MTHVKKENHLLWKERLERAQQFSGGLRTFCKAEGISESAMYYWRTKLNPSITAKDSNKVVPPFARATVGSHIPKVSQSLPVTTDLPDAEWIASFLCHLVRGLK
jgi:hypothetical protein